MSKTATIQARIDPKVKKKAKSVLDKLHLTMSEAISMFLTQVSLNKAIPFEIMIPNELTAKTLKNLYILIKQYSNPKKLFKAQFFAV